MNLKITTTNNYGQEQGRGRERGGDRELRILDIGCGTGAIGLALLHELKHATCTAIDISKDAVTLAQTNAGSVLGEEAWARRYECHHMSLEEFVASDVGRNALGMYDIIVSNPPYIPSSAIASLQKEVRDYEDIRALDGGADGLDVVRQIISKGPALLRSGAGTGTSATASDGVEVGVGEEAREGEGRGRGEIWLEVSEEHPDAMVTTLSPLVRPTSSSGTSSSGASFSSVRAIRDLSGNPRFVHITL